MSYENFALRVSNSVATLTVFLLWLLSLEFIQL